MRSHFRYGVAGRNGRGLGASAQRQRGVASLIVVMVLFFVMALVAAYTNRNLIFEQRTSVNQYRSTQAIETAEAGLEWALAQLDGGRIDNACLEAGAVATDTSFRQRYLSIDPAGSVARLTQGGAGTPPRRAGCVWTGAAWRCDCPSNADPAPLAPVGPGLFPAFWVSFSQDDVTQPGVIRIIANGCTRLDTTCLSAPDGATNVDGVARVTTLVALKSSLTTPPAAALTVVGSVAGGGALAAYNTATDRGGITIQAGGPVNYGAFTLGSIPGTPASASVVASDASLNLISGNGFTLFLAATPDFSAADRMFASVFGAWPDTYRLQPGAVRFNCPAAGCRLALANVVAMNPDRVIWIDGDLTLESAGDVGSAPDPADPTVPGPATIVATGNLVFTAPGARIFGFVYTRSGNWTGSGEIQGAAFTEGNLAATAAPTVVFNGAVIDSLRRRAGSFVRLPGGWRDYP